MKLIKRLIKLILFLIFILIIGIVVVVALGYDSSKMQYQNNTTLDVEEELGNDVDSSLDNIVNTSYQSNNVKIDLTLDQLNSLLTTTLQKSYPNYLVDGGNLISTDKYTISSVEFTSSGSDLSLVLRTTIFSNYKTSIRIKTSLEMTTGNKLVLKFESIKLGTKIGISRNILINILKNFTIENNTGLDIDIKNLTFTLDINDLILESCPSELLKDIMIQGGYSVEMSNKNLTLTVDTSKLFDGGKDHEIAGSFNDLELQTKLASSISKLETSITLTEEELNGLLKNAMNEKVEKFNFDLSFGTKTIPLTLDSLYVKLANSTLLSNLKIKEVKTSTVMEYTYVYSNGILTLNITKAQVAESMLTSPSEIISSISFNINDYLGDLKNVISITNIELTSTNAILTYSIK